MAGLRALVSRAIPVARACAPIAARTVSQPRRLVPGWLTAARPSERCGAIAGAWARGIQHTPSTAIERTPPAESGSASGLAAAAASGQRWPSAALADVAPSTLLRAKRKPEEHDKLRELEQENMPYCEQLASAGAWQEPASADMEASYEGLTGMNCCMHL
jgi:hypothetical protein